MGKMFRLLTADEVECRVSQVSQYKDECTILLYKDARCDMNILDETVGQMNWQREHVLIDGQLFCRVGIRDEHENYVSGFTWKEDVGTESYTAAEKGRASDAFKRACFNWGIGRELYTAPTIVVPCKRKEKKGKQVTYDRFKVTEIGYDENERINHLVVINENGEKVWSTDMEEAKEERPSKTHLNALRSAMKKKNITEEAVEARFGKIDDFTMEIYTKVAQLVEKSSGDGRDEG